MWFNLEILYLNMNYMTWISPRNTLLKGSVILADRSWTVLLWSGYVIFMYQHRSGFRNVCLGASFKSACHLSKTVLCFWIIENDWLLFCGLGHCDGTLSTCIRIDQALRHLSLVGNLMFYFKAVHFFSVLYLWYIN